VQNGQQGTYAYVVKADDTVEPRPVTVGRTLSDGSVIDKGLAAGERVVTDGQLRLRPGTKVEILAPETTAAEKRS
jgi:multidrug efflux system membrane fusion protein